MSVDIPAARVETGATALVQLCSKGSSCPMPRSAAKKDIISLSFKKGKTLEMSFLTHTQHHVKLINQEGEQLLGFSWKMSEIKVT